MSPFLVNMEHIQIEKAVFSEIYIFLNTKYWNLRINTNMIISESKFLNWKLQNIFYIFMYWSYHEVFKLKMEKKSACWKKSIFKNKVFHSST